MKIMQVIPSFCFGGAEIMCENLCYALTAMGHEVLAVSLYREHTPISRRMEAAGVRIEYLDKTLGLDLSMVGKLTNLMKWERPQVVHTHLDVIKYAAAAAKLAGVKKCVHTVHSVAYKEAEGRIQKIINNTYYKLGWSRPVALSPEVRDTIASFYDMDRDRISVIYNGVDLSRCIPKEGYTAGETVNILHVGRFDVPKNHPGLLRTFRKLIDRGQNCHLHLVGDGDLRPEMEALAENLELTKYVTFHGMQSNVYPYLHEADVFVLPSLYEGIPMTIIEAMGTGLPIAASRVGGIPDLLRNGESGLLVPCEEEAVADALEMLVKDADLRERMGRSAKQDSQRFSALTMAEEYCKIYGI